MLVTSAKRERRRRRMSWEDGYCKTKKQDKSIATEETRQRELCSFLSLSLSLSL
jgi:hypothetical protein